MPVDKNTAGVLNQLIQMHYDRIEGYKLACKVLKEEDEELRKEFIACCDDSKRHIARLAEQVWQNEGKTTMRSSVAGKLFRAWMSMRCSIATRNKAAIISLCLFGEYAMQKAYETAQYRNDEICEEARTLIQEQQILLKRHYQVQKEHYDMPMLLG